jgi:hypothetical protein
MVWYAAKVANGRRLHYAQALRHFRGIFNSPQRSKHDGTTVRPRNFMRWTCNSRGNSLGRHSAATIGKGLKALLGLIISSLLPQKKSLVWKALADLSFSPQVATRGVKNVSAFTNDGRLCSVLKETSNGPTMHVIKSVIAIKHLNIVN